MTPLTQRGLPSWSVSVPSRQGNSSRRFNYHIDAVLRRPPLDDGKVGARAPYRIAEGFWPSKRSFIYIVGCSSTWAAASSPIYDRSLCASSFRGHHLSRLVPGRNQYFPRPFAGRGEWVPTWLLPQSEGKRGKRAARERRGKGGRKRRRRREKRGREEP